MQHYKEQLLAPALAVEQRSEVGESQVSGFDFMLNMFYYGSISCPGDPQLNHTSFSLLISCNKNISAQKKRSSKAFT